MGHTEVASIAALGGISVAAATYYWASRPKTQSQHENLPSKIRRLVVTQPDPELEKVRMVVEETSMPKIKYGQVLVKMEAVPVVCFKFCIVWKLGDSFCSTRKSCSNVFVLFFLMHVTTESIGL